MTRKHYIALASALATLRGGESRDEVVQIVATALNASNGNFNKERFLAFVEKHSR